MRGRRRRRRSTEMAEHSAPASLATPFGTISFNTGTGDEYRITNIEGLDGAPIRTQVDDAPQTDGGLVYPFFFGARHITIEGQLRVRSQTTTPNLIGARNAMEDALVSALASIIRADGVFSFTRTGASARALAVRNDVTVQFSGSGLIKDFIFGLVAANPHIA